MENKVRAHINVVEKEAVIRQEEAARVPIIIIPIQTTEDRTSIIVNTQQAEGVLSIKKALAVREETKEEQDNKEAKILYQPSISVIQINS